MPTFNRLTGNSNTNNAATTATLDPITATAGARVVLGAVSTSGGALTSVTDNNGGTWAQVAGSPIGDLSIWARSTTPPAGTVITLNDATQDGFLWEVVEVLNSTGLVVTSEASTGSGATSLTVTMPAPAAGSATLGFFYIDGVIGNIAPGGTFTELGSDVTMSGPATTFTAAYDTTARTSAGVTFPAAQGFGFVLEYGGTTAGVTGSGAASAPQGTATGSGTAKVTGSGSATSPQGTAAGTGTATTTATGSSTAPSGTATGSGTATVSGSGSATADQGTADGDGTSTTTGTGSADAPTATAQGSSGAQAVTGTGAATAEDGAATGAGTSSTSGDGTAAGTEATASGAGTVTGEAITRDLAAGPPLRTTLTAAAPLPQQLTAGTVPTHLTAGAARPARLVAGRHQ